MMRQALCKPFEITAPNSLILLSSRSGVYVLPVIVSREKYGRSNTVRLLRTDWKWPCHFCLGLRGHSVLESSRHAVRKPQQLYLEGPKALPPPQLSCQPSEGASWKWILWVYQPAKLAPQEIRESLYQALPAPQIHEQNTRPLF